MNKKEAYTGDDDDDDDCVERLAMCGSICVNPKKCIIHFKPGRTYIRKIKLLNMTDRPQIVQIQQSENKIFKFPDLTTLTIQPNNSWNLEYTFSSYSNQQFKGYLNLKNTTDRDNLAIELWAIPKTYSSFPSIINFGNVDIETNVTRKLHLEPESYPYPFRIFIPYAVNGLSVNPLCGEVPSDTPTEVTITYKPRSYITLSAVLVLYVLKGNRKPRVVTLTAVTKPKIKRRNSLLNTNKIMPIKMYKTPLRKSIKPADKRENDIVVFNRLTLNKILMNKRSTTPTESHAWLNPLGEADEVYRNSYAKNSKKFMENVKIFGDAHKVAVKSKIARHEPVTTDEEIQYVIDKRDGEWNDYKDESKFIFDDTLDRNFWKRCQMYNKFVNAVKMIIIKNRLLTRLNLFNAMRINDITNTT
ncbi:Immunoglobulin-like fold [Cinara cedri]|uniref:Immunoglobulin-like fold n=1 Tax=Cinara cedri TaxID=506608 RepID=A0A5E4MF99_9HEMI|nr:Immunoglobulin-like fold [Cinara cedri]